MSSLIQFVARLRFIGTTKRLADLNPELEAEPQLLFTFSLTQIHWSILIIPYSIKIAIWMLFFLGAWRLYTTRGDAYAGGFYCEGCFRVYYILWKKPSRFFVGRHYFCSYCWNLRFSSCQKLTKQKYWRRWKDIEMNFMVALFWELRSNHWGGSCGFFSPARKHQTRHLST